MMQVPSPAGRGHGVDGKAGEEAMKGIRMIRRYEGSRRIKDSMEHKGAKHK